jgi:FkbM family methyltransferase
MKALRAPLLGGALALGSFLTFCVAAGALGIGGAMLAALVYAGAAVLIRLGLVDHGLKPFGLANMLTLFRLVVACILFAFVPQAPFGDAALWTVAMVAGVIVALDGVDGVIARRQGLATPFGARFDMEVDALAILALSLLAARNGIGWWIVASGLLRYAFVAASWVWPFLAAALPHSERRRLCCVVQAGTLVVALAPALTPGARIGFAALGFAAAAWSFAVDVRWLWRNRAAPAGRFSPASLFGVLRSLAIYYGIPGRTRRLMRLYAPFVSRGGLAFDIGAHVGNRVRVWRNLGARVVAVEPQPALAATLRRFYGLDRGVVLSADAVDARPGTATLHVSDRNPTVTTIEDGFVAAAGRSDGFAGVCWNRTVTVAATTLDALIARHGRPDFIKIDVEGAEARVLAGLSQAVPALSFEIVPALREGAACLDQLARLGRYRFNWSVGESHVMAWPEWRDADAVRAWLATLRPDDRSGDLYARLEGAGQASTS